MRVTGKTKLYSFLYPHMNFMVKRFYRQFRAKGFEKISAEDSVILAPNHQNAFMDAIVLLDGLGRKNQLSYLVRASIFKKPVVAKLLHSINMLPVYRKDYDGVENMDKNDEVFDNCKYLLENKRPLMIFPEATHHLKRRLIPLKKGITRIAFGADEANQFKLNIKIYPIGINYSNAQYYYEDVLVMVGEPIELKDYYEVYKESPAKAHIAIKFELEKRMRELMIDIRSDEYYHLIDHLCWIDVNNAGLDDFEEVFHRSKKLIARAESYLKKDDNEAHQMQQMSIEYFSSLDREGLKDKDFSPWADRFNLALEVVAALIFSPLLAFGALHLFPAMLVPHRVVKNKIKDPGFRSSVKVALAAFILPVIHIVMASIICMVYDSFMAGFMYWLAMVLTAELVLFFYNRWNRILRFIKVGRLKKEGKADVFYKQRETLSAFISRF